MASVPTETKTPIAGPPAKAAVRAVEAKTEAAPAITRDSAAWRALRLEARADSLAATDAVLVEYRESRLRARLFYQRPLDDLLIVAYECKYADAILAASGDVKDVDTATEFAKNTAKAYATSCAAAKDWVYDWALKTCVDGADATNRLDSNVSILSHSVCRLLRWQIEDPRRSVDMGCIANLEKTAASYGRCVETLAAGLRTTRGWAGADLYKELYRTTMNMLSDVTSSPRQDKPLDTQLTEAVKAYIADVVARDSARRGV